MAKSRYAIEMDFQNAKQQADQLEFIARNIQKLTDNQLASCMSGISSSWKGDNAAAFVNKGNKVGNNLRISAGNLKNTAQTIRDIAARTYRAEMRAYEIAMARKYR